MEVSSVLLVLSFHLLLDLLELLVQRFVSILYHFERCLIHSSPDLLFPLGLLPQKLGQFLLLVILGAHRHDPIKLKLIGVNHVLIYILELQLEIMHVVRPPLLLK